MNSLIFHATTPDEINACAWSLIRYLNFTNLKPSPDIRLVIFTDQPAHLEAYSAFFQSFEFRRPSQILVMKELNLFSGQTKGNLLFIGKGVAPNDDLASLFASIQNGQKFILRSAEGQPILIGWNSVQFDLDQVHENALPSVFESYADIQDFPLLLRHFFRKYGEESVPNLVKLSSTIDILRIREQKTSYEQLPFLKKLGRKVRGKGWNIVEFVK